MKIATTISGNVYQVSRMLDFTRIIASVAGQRETLEELVCQIARRVPPNGSSEFRRIHGAGGDGGVEAGWLLTNGEEVGYQAKYYVTSAGIDWSAIDNSVETALSTHPATRQTLLAWWQSVAPHVNHERGHDWC